MVAIVTPQNTDFTPVWTPSPGPYPANSHVVHAITHKGASDNGGDTTNTVPPSGWEIIHRNQGVGFRPSAYIVGAQAANASGTSITIPGDVSGSSFTIVVLDSSETLYGTTADGYSTTASITLPALAVGETLIVLIATDNNAVIPAPTGSWDTFHEVAQYSGGAVVTREALASETSSTLNWQLGSLSNWSIYTMISSPAAPAVPVSVAKVGSPVVITGTGIGQGITETPVVESGVAAIHPNEVEVEQRLTISRDDAGPLQNADIPNSLNVEVTFQTRDLAGDSYDADVELRRTDNTLLALPQTVGTAVGTDVSTTTTPFTLTSQNAADYADFKINTHLRLATQDPGGGPGPSSPLVRTEQPYWWDHDGGDPFDLQLRSPGGNYWVADNVSFGAGSGTSNDPWHLQDAINKCDGNQIPVGSRIWMKKGLGYPAVEVNGRSGVHNARYTIIAEDRTKYETGWKGELPWAIRFINGSSCWQLVGLHAENDAMNAGYLSVINSLPTSGPTSSADYWLRDQFFPGRDGMLPNSIAFQLDGFGTNNIPGNVTFVNLTCKGWGEGPGGYHCGSYAVIGGEFWDCGRFSPNGRSAISFSRGNTGTNVGSQAESDIYTFGGTGYRGVVFGTYCHDNYQLITSFGIGEPNKLLDGNGIITPTDQGFSNSVNEMGRGRHLIQCNVSITSGAIGITGFQGSIEGVDCNLNTVYASSMNIPHSQGTSPVGANTTKTAGKDPSSHGEIVWWEFASVEPANPFVNIFGNIAVQGGWGGRTIHSENMTVQSGRNFIEGAAPFNVSATNVGDMQLGQKSVDPNIFDPYLGSGSPAVGAAVATDAAIKLDYRGQTIPSSGSIDAGAIQRAATPPPATTIDRWEHYGAFESPVSNGNNNVKDNRSLAHRFVAAKSGQMNGWKNYFTFNRGNPLATGYSEGDGGTYLIKLVPDNGSGLPDETTTLAQAPLWSPGLVGGVSPFGATAYTLTHKLYFADKIWTTPVNIVAGTTYHVIYENVHASPATNYCSINDNLSANDDRNLIGPSDAQWGLTINYGAGWLESTNRENHTSQGSRYTPCAMAIMNNSADNFGNAYITEPDQFPVDSANRVRQNFTPSQSRVVKEVSISCKGVGTLTGVLRAGASTIDTWVFNTTSSGEYIFYYQTFTPFTLNAGTNYTIEFTGTGGLELQTNRDVSANIGQSGDGAAFGPGASWDDGWAEVSTNSGSSWSVADGVPRYDVSGLCFALVT